MKIACISASRVPSTTANSIQVMKTCQALTQMGNEVHLFVPTQKEKADWSDLASLYGLNTEFIIKRYSSRARLHRYEFAYQAVLNAYLVKADLCYTWFIQAGIFSLFARLPVLLELNGLPEGRFGPSLFRFFQRIPGKKRYLPITRGLATLLQKQFGIDPDNRSLVRISPNAVDLERYADLPMPSQARQALGLPEKLTASYTGHLYPGRGIDLLMELACRYPEISFLWVGGRPEDVNSWRERLATEGVLNVILTGSVENSRLPLYHAAAEILLMPYERVITGSSGGNSAAYASPMKMFEYMACKRAIISSDLPVIREVLNPSNAVLCPAEEVDAWARAFGSLAKDEPRRSSLAAQAWQDVQCYTWIVRARNALEGFIDG